MWSNDMAHVTSYNMTFRKMSNFRILFYNSPLFTSDMIADILPMVAEIFKERLNQESESRKRKSDSEIS